MSAKMGTQLCSSAPMMLPPDVHGVTMISSPGSGFTAPMHVCMADVPEFTVMAHSTPCLSANAASNFSTTGPLPMLPDLITSLTAATSSSPKSWPGPNGLVRTGSPPCIARACLPFVLHLQAEQLDCVQPKYLALVLVGYVGCDHLADLVARVQQAPCRCRTGRGRPPPS